MNAKEKSDFYNLHRQCIHPVIKSDPATKPMWRKLFWTTGKNSVEYKCGCVDILMANFPYLFNELLKTYEHRVNSNPKTEGGSS